MDEFDQRSWWAPAPDDAAWALPDDLRAADPLSGRDCGWVNQMRPFVRHFSRPGEQVFDPFCGFGSTLLAAALEGRNAHGRKSIRHARSWHARVWRGMRWKRRWWSATWPRSRRRPRSTCV
ncbi:hypothetical protein GW15_0203615 [Xanthomonas axonopodis pv. vasculorum]|uniref:DNA methylase N-4/N-6 domain-containing protein n=1 Tax=Xanthomonas axonopodis pv. vasculorum TaxID=325777 RepID=A0A098Q2Q6_9XANT|nr:hypothetical protein GW15_0203615 [Xanthomonas axonopodis pv. vasculorum]PPV09863.1 hypothetical protein XavaCFBP5823_12090 [Xanthomonas axonopodis pv. vasculorum]